MFGILVVEGIVFGQRAPSAPDHPWDASSAKQQLPPPPRLLPHLALDPSKSYKLSEVVDIAEHNNPDTRVAWENAKARAADLGITKSTLYPTLAGAVLASSFQTEVFFGNSFQRQTVETYPPVFILDYSIFDLGR